MWKIRFPQVLSIVFLFLITSSCVSGKKITYFQNMESLRQEANNVNRGLNIKHNDLLTIIVSGENPEAVQPFNLPLVSTPRIGEGSSVGGQQQLQAYLVDSEGNIQFPGLGTIKAVGRTRQDLSALLEDKLSKFLKNPIVNVRIINFQVTVLGEVKAPGAFNISDEHLTLSQALGLAGDLTIYGKRENVLVIRESEEGKTYKYLDLTKSEVLNSPFYYLQQNDVIYVEPIGPRKQAASYLGTASSYLSVASVITSLILLFTR